MPNNNNDNLYLADLVAKTHPLAKRIINIINEQGRLINHTHQNKLTLDEIQIYEQLTVAKIDTSLKLWYQIMPNHQRMIWKKVLDLINKDKNKFNIVINHTLNDQWYHQNKISIARYKKYLYLINHGKAPDQQRLYNWLQLLEINLVAILSNQSKDMSKY